MKWLARLALLAVLSACGRYSAVAVASATRSQSASATPATATASPEPVVTIAPPPPQCSLPQSAPTFAASPPSTRSLALVSLQDGHNFVVVDLTDFAHRSTVSELGGSVNSGTVFVNDHELSDAVLGVGLYRMPLSGSPSTLVAPCGDKPFAWSPDGTSAAYITGTLAGGANEVHFVARGSDRVVDRIAGSPPWTACASTECADQTDLKLLYSPAGAYVSLLFHLPALADFRMWKADGTRVQLNYDDSTTVMSVWSGDAFYWEDRQGIERWRNGEVSVVMTWKWVRPHASPAGGQIVYGRFDVGGGPTVWLYDTATATTRQIAQARSDPAFLTSRYIWYKGANGAYVYDLQAGVEIPSDITSVWDVWPHAA